MSKPQHIILAGNLVINDKKEIFLLYRIKHKFYETPGGKVRSCECKDIKRPTIAELRKTAKRELCEEVGGIKEITFMGYFGNVKFEIPDGRSATAHKFITKVKGRLYAKEDIFDKKKSMFIPFSKLIQYPLSRDLQMFLPKINSYLKKN